MSDNELGAFLSKTRGILNILTALRAQTGIDWSFSVCDGNLSYQFKTSDAPQIPPELEINPVS